MKAIKKYWKWIAGILVISASASTLLMGGEAPLGAVKPQVGDVVEGKSITEYDIEKHEIIEGSGKTVILYSKLRNALSNSIPSDLQGKVVSEDVAKRTGNARFFKTSKADETVAQFLPGDTQYYKDKDGKWWNLDYATTTPATFDGLKKVPTGVVGFVRKAIADTFNPSVDGRITYTNVADPTNWDAARNATAGVGNGFADATCGGGQTPSSLANQGAGTRVRIDRLFMVFDTSAIGAGSTITAADVQLYVEAVANNSDDDGDDFVSIIHTDMADDAVPDNADYDQITDTALNTPHGANVDFLEMHETSEREDISTIATGAYVTWTFNATGIGYVSKTGNSEFGMAEGHDILDNPVGSTLANAINVTCSEGANDPILTVTFSGGGGGGFNFIDVISED